MRRKDAFPSKYLKAEDIEDQGDLALTIKNVDWETIKNMQTNKDEQRPVMTFKEEINGERAKPLILNVTNWNAIEKVCGSEESDDWTGKRITLYTTEVEAFGETKLAIRVRSKSPARKPQTANRPAQREPGDDAEQEGE